MGIDCNWYNAPCVANGVIDFLKKWFNKAIDLLTEFKDWLSDLPKRAFSEILDGCAHLLELIPVPDAFSQARSAFSGLPSNIVWFLDMSGFKVCLTIIIGAYIIRFLIRRIPIVG